MAPDILDSSDFDVLDELQKEQLKKARRDPEFKENLVLTTLLALRNEQKAANVKCETGCRPGLERRIGSLEWFRKFLCGVVAGVTGLAAVAVAAYSFIRWVLGG